MAEQQSAVASGTLDGINLSGEPEEATLPPDAEAPEVEQPVEAPEPVTEPEPAAEPEGEPDPAEADEATDEPEDEARFTKDDEPADTKPKGSPVRSYVVLREQTFEDESVYFTEVHKVESRNAQNAMRKAFKEIHGDAAEEGEATLVVVPETMWRPTKVRIAKTEKTTVSFE